MSWRNKRVEHQDVRQIMISQYRKQFLLAIRQRKIEQALTCFKQLQQELLEEMELEESIYNLAGLCYYQVGNWKEARVCFLVSYKINSSDENKACQYLKLLTEEAVNHFEEIESQVVDAMLEKNYKKAEKLLKQSRKVEATIQNDLLLGLCQYGRGKELGALICFRDALEKDPSNQTALRLMRSLKINNGGIGHLLWKTIMRY